MKEIKELTPEQLAKREKRREIQKKWEQSEKGKAYKKMYEQNPKNKAKRKAKRETPEAREYHRAYSQRPEMKEYYKNYFKEKLQDAGFKNARNEYKRTWRKTDRGKILMKIERQTIGAKSSRIESKARCRAVKLSCQVGDRQAIREWLREWKSLPKVNCHWCGEPASPNECHTDHVIPLSKGGTHDLGNLVISCASCNYKKHVKLPSEWVGKSKNTLKIN